MAYPDHDPRIDAYIAARAAFARPILERLRAMVHAADPEVVETMKWSMPFFVHRGQPLCHMAGFKAHAAFGFWRGAGIVGDADRDTTAMGQFGRIATLADLPEEASFAAMVREAVTMAEAGGRRATAARTARPPAEIPAELATHFATDAAARTAWDSFPPSQQREYADWIAAAKRAETRARRIAQACEWIGQGKRRNW